MKIKTLKISLVWLLSFLFCAEIIRKIDYFPIPILLEMENFELLLPAQNKKSVQAAVGNANAVYFGTETFNMRMNARNITQADLEDFIGFCHENGLKAYMTTNILIFEQELDLLRSLIEDAREAGVDALIVHDFATIRLAKEYGIPFHISTQQSVSNSSSAGFFEELGAERIIMARECSLEQISEISKVLGSAKVEAFVHGAMCTSISGRCYFSQCIHDSNDFSANRGKCLQPCRHKWKLVYEDGQEFDYDGYFFLNAKDLCMIEHIPEMVDAGIYSFKVEGRMRSPHYVETVGRLYRKALDAHFDGTYSAEQAKKWKVELAEVYNRGFSTGFYFDRPTEMDINRESSGNMATTRKTHVGDIITFYRNKSVAKLNLFRGKFRPGDILYIEGGDMGSFYKHTISEMYHKNKIIQETPDIAELNDGFVITIKTDKPVGRNDKVFIYI